LGRLWEAGNQPRGLCAAACEEDDEGIPGNLTFEGVDYGKLQKNIQWEIVLPLEHTSIDEGYESKNSLYPALASSPLLFQIYCKTCAS
jgi:hypothetical protein